MKSSGSDSSAKPDNSVRVGVVSFRWLVAGAVVALSPLSAGFKLTRRKYESI
jgi:hypothetical protein